MTAAAGLSLSIHRFPARPKNPAGHITLCSNPNSSPVCGAHRIPTQLSNGHGTRDAIS